MNDRNLPASSTSPRKRGFGGWIWLAIIAALVALQWPVLKESFYQVAGVEVPESPIKWQHDWTTARAMAQDQGKPILAVFGADWCPPCRTMKREVWPDAEVAAAVEQGYVPLYVDVDESSQAELVARYGVRGIPAVLVLDAQGNVQRQQHSMSRSGTLEFLDSGSQIST